MYLYVYYHGMYPIVSQETRRSVFLEIIAINWKLFSFPEAERVSSDTLSRILLEETVGGKAEGHLILKKEELSLA